MALDQQRNWDISMAENLETIQRKAQLDRARANGQQGDPESSVVTFEPRPFEGPPIHLPDEILTSILDFVSQQPEAQKTLASCCLLSHQWYGVAVPYLYYFPRLYGKSFDPFARTICPSINLHVRKSPLSNLVHHLDLGGLVHQGSRSVTARLLGRTKANLESFRAPQTSFALNCLPALARCLKLRNLDLSLVSESPPLPELLKSVSHLERLDSFRLPRSAGFGSYDGQMPIYWPPKLQSVVLSGGIDAWFLAGAARFPDTLRSMTIEHCPQARTRPTVDFFIRSVRKLPMLENLKVSNMPRLGRHCMNDLLYILQNIRSLSVSVDYITPGLFDGGGPGLYRLEEVLLSEGKSFSDRLRHENLHTLEFTNSGNPSIEENVAITPIDVLIAIDEDVLPALRVVRVAKSLSWFSEQTTQDTEALTDALVSRHHARWEDRSEEFASMSMGQWQAAKPGVWPIHG